MSTAVDPLFGLIQISTSIKIKRSDGRIHLAKVVQLSPESKSVGVEWNEHGEVKGKEILLDLVFELNNELRPNTAFKQPAPVANQTVRPTAAVNIPSSGLSVKIRSKYDYFTISLVSYPMIQNHISLKG